MKHGEVELTQEQLAMAFRHLSRPGWPATLEAALADPIRGKCVRGLARSLSRGGRPSSPHYVPPTPRHAPPVPPTPTAPPVRQKAQRFDARKAAANDLDN